MQISSLIEGKKREMKDEQISILAKIAHLMTFIFSTGAVFLSGRTYSLLDLPEKAIACYVISTFFAILTILYIVFFCILQVDKKEGRY